MDPSSAQDELSSIIMKLSVDLDCYFWRPSGGCPNSLCNLLGLTEEEMKTMMRACGVYQGDDDNIIKNQVENLFRHKMGLDWSYYKHKTMPKGDYFLKIGKGKEIRKPKDLYSDNGEVEKRPVDLVHCFRNRSCRGRLASFLSPNNQPLDKESPEKKQSKVSTPMDDLFSYIRELLRGGGTTIPTHKARKIKRLVAAIVDQKILEMVKNAMGKISTVEDDATTPDRPATSAPIITPPNPLALTEEIDDEVGRDDEDDDIVVEPVSARTDDLIQQLKEETVLQSPLHKRVHGRKERVFCLEHNNGRRMVAAVPPDVQSSKAFVKEARKTKWVDIMLNKPERMEGMLLCLAEADPILYAAVAKKKKISTEAVALTTVQTMALARLGNFNGIKLKYIKSFMRKVGKARMNHCSKEVDRIDKQVGNHRTNDVEFGTTIFEWSRSSVKGKEKKAPEKVNYWNASLANEIEAEVDLYLTHLFSEDLNLQETPTISYKGDGFKEEGVTMLIGGDHGDKNCPVNAKINLSSPRERKKRKQLNYHCPIVEFASVECTKDAHELMDTTIMPKIKQQMRQLKDSCVTTVYDKKDVRGTYRSHIVPKTINQNTIAFHNNSGTTTMTCGYGNKESPTLGSVLIKDNLQSVPFFQLSAKVTVHQFNELFVGDLAFLAMLIGVNNSDGDYCLMCELMGSTFNTDITAHQNLKRRTREYLAECLEKFIAKRNKSSSPESIRNYNGVNSSGLLDIDPTRIIAPIPHCPMGLVDKILESFKIWINLHVEDLKNDEGEAARAMLKLATQQHDMAERTHASAKKLAKENKKNKQAKDCEEQADAPRKKAKKEEQKARKTYNNIIGKLNARKESLCQLFEGVHRKNGVLREHYHGGKFNGVNCIRIMDKADDIFLGNERQEGFLQHIKRCESQTTSVEQVETVVRGCAKLLAIVDSIWSKVRGIDCGLLPEEAQTDELEAAIKAGKKQWLELGIGTQQPKWHLTFDGHLLEQVKQFEGLADKADDSIEHFHQVLKVLRTRHRSVSTCERRERCIRRELRRKRSPEINKEVQRHEKLTKINAGSKRKQEAEQRQEGKREAKRVKREAAIMWIARSKIVFAS